MSFNFGATNTTSNTTPSFSFGSPGAPAAGGLGFSSPATTGLQFNTPAATQPSTGLSFGTPATTTNFSFGSTSGGSLSFGTPTTTNTGLSFKTPTTGLSFGTTAQPTTGLSFGTTPQATTGLSFGTTPQATTGLSFGSTSQPTTGLSFGTTPQATTGLSFGTTPQATTGLSFGTISQPSTGLSFGTTPQATTGLSFGTTAQPTTGLSFGTTPQTTTGLSFGTTTQPTTGLGFGTTPQTTTGLSFGTTAQPTTGLSFGATPQSTLALSTPSTGLSFGGAAQTQSTTTQAPLSFGLTLAQPTTATSTTTGLSFGATPSFSTAKPTLSFGTTTTTTAAPTGLLGFTTPKTTATTGFSLTTSGAPTSLFATPAIQTTTAGPTTPFKGLGGIDTAQSLSGSGAQSENKCVKDNQLPNEIMQTIDGFKNFVKQQKNLAGEVSSTSEKPLKKVMEDTESMRLLLSSINNVQQKNRTLIHKLKTDTSNCLVESEMAQRTQDTPMGLQNDNVAPLEFFISLVAKFERDVQVLRQEIDNTEKHVKSLAQPSALSPQELSIAMKRLHDSFIALTGRLQTVHTQVVAQKEQHLSMRRHFNKDTSNIFHASLKGEILPRRTTVQTTISPGPSPFSSIGNQSMNLLSFQESNMSPFQSANQFSGWGSSTTPNIMSGTQNTFLQSPGGALGTSVTDNQNFQLLKPPLGNKRGKR